MCVSLPSTPVSKATSFFKLSLASVVIVWLLSFENVAELKFFGSGLIPFAGLPFAAYIAVWGAADKYLELPCDQLSNTRLLRMTQNPILFKGCIPSPHNLTVKDDFVTFPDSYTNVFPSCGDAEVIRYLNYTSIEGVTNSIEEPFPCASTTLQEKIEFHQGHYPSRDGPYMDVNVFFLGSEEEQELEKDFKRKGFLPKEFSFLSYVTILVHFFSSGLTFGGNQIDG